MSENGSERGGQTKQRQKPTCLQCVTSFWDLVLIENRPDRTFENPMIHIGHTQRLFKSESVFRRQVSVLLHGGMFATETHAFSFQKPRPRSRARTWRCLVGSVCEKFGQVCISEGRASEALLPLRSAAIKMGKDTSSLTPLHPEFLQVSLTLSVCYST